LGHSVSFWLVGWLVDWWIDWLADGLIDVAMYGTEREFCVVWGVQHHATSTAKSGIYAATAAVATAAAVHVCKESTSHVATQSKCSFHSAGREAFDAHKDRDPRGRQSTEGWRPSDTPPGATPTRADVWCGGAGCGRAMGQPFIDAQDFFERLGVGYRITSFYYTLLGDAVQTLPVTNKAEHVNMMLE
jgi:hypothetical protein